VIKVFYSGYGYVYTKNEKIRAKVQKATTGVHHGFFVLGNTYEICLMEIKEARIEILTNYFDADDDNFNEEFINISGIGEIEKTEIGLVILNKQLEVEPIKVNTKRDIYRKQSGNYLRLYSSESIIFDKETAITDKAPAKKELSETENRANLNVIYGLLEMLKKSGNSQNEIISELEKFDYFGMSESNLKKLFAKANNINKREH
jgi:hypothetical protein